VTGTSKTRLVASEVDSCRPRTGATPRAAMTVSSPFVIHPGCPDGINVAHLGIWSYAHPPPRTHVRRAVMWECSLNSRAQTWANTGEHSNCSLLPLEPDPVMRLGIGHLPIQHGETPQILLLWSDRSRASCLLRSLRNRLIQHFHPHRSRVMGTKPL
jgi:hypothetical protein